MPGIPKCLPFLLALLMFSLVGEASARDFVRGDVNTDGIVDIADPVVTLTYLFQGGVRYCADAMDTNDDGAIDLSDPIGLFGFLYSAGPPPGAPFGQCGEDPTADSLDCDSHSPCNLGDAIGGLTQDEFASFVNGRELMSKAFTPEEGLGPLYNSVACKSCHSAPVVGGSAPIYRNFYLVAVGAPGNQSPPPGAPSLALPSFNSFDGQRVAIPDPADVGGLPVVAAHRNAPPFLGVGLFEFVPNSAIVANSDPDDLFVPDGISGRYNTDGNGNIGRFGYKLQANFIEAFIRGAAFNQMGITTNPVLGSDGIVSYRFQIGADFDSPTIDNDAAPDPEISVQDFGDIIAFNRFVAPPEPAIFGPDELAGETLFEQINCVGCHVPTLPSSVGPLNAYTDLLLHDLGPGLADGISQGVPQFSTIAGFTVENEFRTQPLWGVSLHGPWLHDGSAGTMEEAILMHGGEAQTSRDAFDALTPLEREQVIKFLEAL